MSKAERQQDTNFKFCEMLGAELGEWCELKRLEKNEVSLIAYLVKHNLIRQSVINKYVCLQLYPEILKESKSKEQAIFTLSEILPLEPRQIWTILNNYYIKFKPNSFKFP
jgi:hypothetical protein